MRNFKRTLLNALLAGCMHVHAATVIPPAKVVITTDTPAIAAGLPLEIAIEVTNISQEELNCSDSINRMTGQNNNFVLDVRDAKGNPASKRFYEHEELASGKVVFRSLKPQESLIDSLIVTRRYVLSPGKYSFQVSRWFPSEAGGGLAPSNVI